MFALGRVRQLVRFVSVVCLVCVPIVPAEAITPSESNYSSTVPFVDLSSPALFPTVTLALPPNIEAPPFIIALMRDMWTRSPTFRRQCARIAAARGGQVLIEIRKPHSVEIRAASVITHGAAGAWEARVEVYIDTDLVEMIAHEMEHVIEQIDGIDLPRMALQGLEGVRAGGFGEHFETARAVATGKRVAREYAGRRRVAS